MRLLVGLGNPGKEYKKNRHNVGFMVIDAIKTDSSNPWKLDKKFNAEVSRERLACCEDGLLIKPQTFMNNSGNAVKAILSYFKLSPKDLLIIHDDIDLALGSIKLSFDSGSAGNNGVQSIINVLKTKGFWRLRIGVGPKKGPTDKFVLKNFSIIQQAKLKKIIQKSIEGIEIMFEEGPEKAQNFLNSACATNSITKQ